MSDEKINVDELLEKAKKPAADALKLHPFYKGKMETTLKCTVRTIDDFAIWYTPGVAAPCRDISQDPEMIYQHTSKGNTVAVISDGTRVLGLGDIGPKAGLPVMEGKALLFKYLGGVDAVPIMLDTKDPDVFIETVLLLQSSFGGINLEDIAQPKCFRILDELREKCEIPVWHDDQQGTATVTLAGLMNALKVVGKNKEGYPDRFYWYRSLECGHFPADIQLGRRSCPLFAWWTVKVSWDSSSGYQGEERSI